MRLPRRSSSGRAVRVAGWRRFLPGLLLILALVLAPALALAQSADSLAISWSAPGDDGSVGTASVYDLRVSESPITPGNFDQALVVPGVPAPRASGSSQRVTVYGLSRDRTYFFAIRTADNRSNWSGISNVVRWDWTFDTAPPLPPHGVQALVQSDGIHLSWDANTEADLAGYNLYRKIGGTNTTRLNNALITDTHYLDTSAPAGGQGVTYEVTAVDQRGNESAHAPTSKIDLVTTRDWELKPGYPNPSRLSESVRIPVVIPATASGDATLQILDSGGRLVRRIPLSNPLPGTIEVTWDGLNDAGRATAPGVYRGWLVAGSARSSVRLLRTP